MWTRLFVLVNCQPLPSPPLRRQGTVGNETVPSPKLGRLGGGGFVVTGSVSKFMQALAPYPSVLLAADHFAEQRQELIDLCIQVQQIPAPTGAEAVRAAWVEQHFLRLGLRDVTIDSSYNVYARRPGKLPKPALLISAHTDTVFPAETDLSVRFDKAAERIYGPGIGDNSLGVASLLLLAETLTSLPKPAVDIWLVSFTIME